MRKSKKKQTPRGDLSFFRRFYWKNRCLVIRTQIRSIQPTTMPRNVTTIHTISLMIPPFLKKVDHLTTISVIQFTTGMSSNSTCTRRLCLFIYVMTFYPLIKILHVPRKYPDFTHFTGIMRFMLYEYYIITPPYGQ